MDYPTLHSVLVAIEQRKGILYDFYYEKFVLQPLFSMRLDYSELPKMKRVLEKNIDFEYCMLDDISLNHLYTRADRICKAYFKARKRC